MVYMPNGMPLLLPLRVRDLQEVPSVVQPEEVRLLQTAIRMAQHDMKPLGNSPAESKFDLINDWP